VSYGRSKPGRPKSQKPIERGCEICAHLRTDGGVAVCGHWRGNALDSTKCGDDFKSAAVERVMIGGTSGVVYQR
jgi:hypothetical protein